MPRLKTVQARVAFRFFHVPRASSPRASASRTFRPEVRLADARGEEGHALWRPGRDTDLLADLSVLAMEPSTSRPGFVVNSEQHHEASGTPDRDVRARHRHGRVGAARRD